MPQLKLVKVVSCSSELREFPADSLVKGVPYTKWKCAVGWSDSQFGSKQAVAVLELESSSQIDSIDIGNECSAFVEVFVGRRADDQDKFQVLIPATSFMDPRESRNELQINRVRLFTKTEMVATVASQKWDLIKIVCSQPFNKQLSYGLCFVRITAPEPEKPTPREPLKIGMFTLKPESDVAADESDAKTVLTEIEIKKSPTNDPVGTGALFKAVREATSKAKDSQSQVSDPSNGPGQSSSLNKRPHSPLSYDPPSKKPTPMPPSRPTGENGTTPKASPAASRIGDKRRSTDGSNSPGPSQNGAAGGTDRKKIKLVPNPPQSSSSKPDPPQTKASTKVKTAPFGQLLAGCTIVLSGYQNPERGHLRTRALALGAKYAGDWHPGCTHLICAFANTPKHKQVRGTGAKVVKGQWINDCHSRKMRLHWRKYCVDKHDDTAMYSDDEIQVADRSGNGNQSDDDSGADTDEEVNRIKNQQNKPKQPEKKGDAAADGGQSSTKDDGKTSTSTADGEPEVDEDGLPILPDFLDGMHFYVLKDVDAADRKRLQRIILSFAGELHQYMDDKVTHIVCLSKPSSSDVTSNMILVKPDWLFECGRANKLVDIGKFKV